jgi:hypothetical protein
MHTLTVNLPATGAGLGTIIGLPAIVVAGVAYWRSRLNR